MTQNRKPPTLARTAGILSSNPQFRSFLAEQFPQAWADFRDLEPPDRAAAVIREACHIKSRAELDQNNEARQLYHQLIGLPFSSWRTQLASLTP